MQIPNEFSTLARNHSNQFLNWILGIILIFSGWQILGIIPILLHPNTDELLQSGNSPYTILNFITLMSGFLFGLVAFIFVAKYIHKRTLISYLTGFKTIQYDRIIFAIVISLLISGIPLILLALASNDCQNIIDKSIECSTGLEFNPNFSFVTYIIFILIALIITPIQVGFEEILFRGYFLQGLGLFTKNPVLLSLIVGSLFMVAHLANPETTYGMAKYMTILMATGTIWALIAIKGNGLELPFGFHLANNLFVFLFITTKNSVITTPALFYDIGIEQTGITWTDVFMSVFFTLFIPYVILAKKYKWGIGFSYLVKSYSNLKKK
ncbi:MAG: CPBP family intramembrane metalloprotease [SAR202 cluster bacterium]|nr:CPBP family intramembrane metalloprotease [SAR202 cluster bacterium]